MMTLARFSPLKWLVAPAATVAFVAAAAAQPNSGSLEDQQIRVQITEVGLLRTLVAVAPDDADLAEQVKQRFSDRDYQVFTDAAEISGAVTSADMRQLAERENADLVVYARIEQDRLRSNASGFKLYEATAVVKVFGGVLGNEITKSVRVSGIRHPDDLEARRSAREKAMEQATVQAIEATLSRAHKLLVHHAVIVNVFSESALLAIMEYMGKMDGVYHVKRVSFDRQTNEAMLEVIGSPRSQTYWRAYLEKLPKTKVNVQVNPNDKLHNKYPDWFLPPSR